MMKAIPLMDAMKYMKAIDFTAANPEVLAFRAKQVKRQTFVLSVQSFVLVASLYCVWLVLGILLP